jgi:hypothetical protein
MTIAELQESIKLSKRLGVKPTRRILAQLRLLELEQTWTRKLKLAQTKLKKYRRKLKRYGN